MGALVKVKPTREPQDSKRPPSARGYVAKARASDICERFDKLADSILLTEPEAAQVVGFSPHALKAWRLDDKRKGRGPTPTYVHGSVRYRVDALKDWRTAVSK